MISNRSRNEMRELRHRRLRARVAGTAEKPRLCVFRSLNHIYAQVIDDESGRTMISASTVDKSLKGTLATGGNQEAAISVGKLIAERALAQGIAEVVFDRGGHIYQGRVKALAEAAREAGLKF